MQKFNIFNANERSNPQVEKLLSEILSTIGYKAVFHNTLKTDILLENKDALPSKIDLIYFDGGEDVNPKLYYRQRHPKTFVNQERCNKEKTNFKLIKSFFPGVPCLGICRGSQFLTVMSGGELIQHVENHTSTHSVTMPNFDKTIQVTSTHHQMMYPFNLDNSKYRILGYSSNILSPVHETTDHNGYVCNLKYPENFVEPEIVYYNDTNALCIQGHPEYDSASKQFKDVTKELLLRLLYNKL